MAITYEPIATTTLGSATTTVTFSSISGSYTDLVLVFDGTNVTGLASTGLRFNGDTGNNYSKTEINGSGTAVSSGRDTSASAAYVGINSNISGNTIINIMNYANTTTYKTILGRGNVPGSSVVGVRAAVGLWRNTAAITSVSVTNGAYNWTAGSTFTLYGIASA
jgi:hypothetical protein